MSEITCQERGVPNAFNQIRFTGTMRALGYTAKVIHIVPSST